MIRVAIVVFFSFLLQLFLSALCVPLSLSGVTILLAPSVLILVANEFSLYESLCSVLLLGLLLDVWIGAPVGTLMLVLALLWFGAIGAIAWLGKPNIWVTTPLIFCFSVAFRVSAAVALGAHGTGMGNLVWSQAISLPFLDVGFGIMFYYNVMRLLNFFGLCEIKEDTSRRLSRRSARIRLE